MSAAAATTSTTASVPVSKPLSMSVHHTGSSGIDAGRALHGSNAMGNREEQHRDSHFSPSSASGSVSGSASSSCPSTTGLKAVDEPDSMVIGNVNANRCQPPHASASGRGGVACHHHPWRGTAAAGMAAGAGAAGNSARHLLQSMSPSSPSSSPSSTATPTETSSLVKVKTDTPDGTRKSRARKRHRHRKNRSRSENDLDSPSTVNSGRDEGDVLTGHADKGHRARTTGNVQNAEPKGERHPQDVLPSREEFKPTESSAPSRSRDGAGDANTAGGSSRPRASANSTGPMIVDSNVSRRSTVSSQQGTAQQPYHPPQPQPQASTSAPFSNVAPSALHSPRTDSHHPLNRRGRGSFGGTSAAAAAAAAASTTAAGRNTVALRLGPARRAIPTAPTSTTPPCRQLSTTTTVGSINITVFLPGMKQPITFHDVPQKRYTNLPDHRPPLRRDKPVRIMLPGSGSGRTQGLRGSYSGDRLIYPAADRSFIFIPRELRPNHRTLSTFFGRGSGRGRGRGGGHVSGGSLDSSAYNAEMLRQGYHGRRVQQQQQQQQQQLSYAAAGYSHSHSLSGSTPYFNHLSTRSRRSSSFGLQAQSPAATLPPRPMPAGLAAIPLPSQASGPGPSSLVRFPQSIGNALKPSSEAQFAVPGPGSGMMMNSPVASHAVTTALAPAMIPTTYPATFPLINPATVPAPPYPPPSHRHIPSDSTSSVQGSTLMSIPMKSVPAAAPVPILQPQPQKRISMPSIINHVQGDTPPPLQRHRQGQAEELGELQEQKYQIPSPAFSAAHQPLQPYDPVVAYPSSTAGEAQGNADNSSSAPHDSERLDRGTTSGDYYTSPYQAFMPSAASGLMVVPHTVAHERNGTVYYNYEYSCDTSTPSFPYQQQQQQTRTVAMQQPPLPDSSAQLYQHAVPPSSSGHFLPTYHPLNSTGYNIPPPPPGPPTAGGFPQFRYSTPVTQGLYGHQPMYSHPSHMQSIPMSMPMNMAMQHPMAAVPSRMQSQPAHMHNIMSSRNGS